jgi:hypothetical protein
MFPVFPDEDIAVAVNNVKARSSIKSCIYKNWSRSKAKQLFSKRDKVLPWAFDDIYWDGMGKVMNEFPKTFQDWVTRHVSDFRMQSIPLAVQGRCIQRLPQLQTAKRRHPTYPALH